MSNITVRNGGAVQVVFGDYRGRAGLSGDGRQVAFAAKAHLVDRVARGTIDGAPFRVLKIGSGLNSGIVVLDVEPEGSLA